MKNYHLNARGFAHHMVLAAVVVGVAVFGTYALVASHADTCGGISNPTSTPVTAPVSGPTSDPNCTPTSDPASGPVSTPVNTLASCTIAMANSKPAGSTVSPVLTFKSQSGSPITNLHTTKIAFSTPDQRNVLLPGVSVSQLNSGTVRTFKLGQQPLGTSPGTGKLSVRAVANNHIVVACHAKITVTI